MARYNVGDKVLKKDYPLTVVAEVVSVKRHIFEGDEYLVKYSKAYGGEDQEMHDVCKKYELWPIMVPSND